jgi:hypothetical protein
MRAYRLRFWFQLQHKEQAKETLVAMSRKLEVVALQIVNRGWNNFFSFTLVGGLLPVAAFLTLLWTFLLNYVTIGCARIRM